MVAPAGAPPEPSELAGAPDCPRCGSRVEPMQEYCLECGASLPAAAPPGPRPGLRAWAWSAVVTALVAVVAAGVVVAARNAQERDERASLTATQPTPTLVETATALPTETETAAAAPPTAETPAAEEPPPPPPANEVIAWPRGARGWTVVLASVPTEQGRAAATRRAKEAAEGGLTQVGVLESASFSSLHPGYFVVFAGVYDSQGQAEQAVALARDRGFEAYPREIVP